MQVYSQNENANPNFRAARSNAAKPSTFGTRNGGRAVKSNRGVLADISNKVVSTANPKGGHVVKKGLTRRSSRPDTSRVASTNSTSTGRGTRPSTSRRGSAAPSYLDAKDMDIISMDVDMSEDETNDSTAAMMAAIDADDLHDTLTFSEFANDIYAFHRQAETTMQASHGYMARQRDINARMREILIDWLIEVHLKFKLEQETLFLTINIIDRFLERRAVTRNKLQLVGCAAMLLASKYEEIYAPEVRDFVYISDQAYTREQILAMETIMLNALEFNLTAPSPLKFVDRFLKVAGKHKDEKFRFQCNYLIEMTLQDFNFTKFLPSMVAASAIFMAGRICGTTASARDNFFSPLLQRYTQYSAEQMQPCMSQMWALLKNESPRYRAVRQKYSSTKFMNIARTDVFHAHCPFFDPVA